MTPAILAMTTLIVIGGFTIVAMIVWMLKKDGPTLRSIVVIMLGFAMVGVGGFGPSFINDYVKLVDALNAVQNSSQNSEAQKAAATAVVQAYANGVYKEEDWGLISATLEQYAVPDLEEILNQAADQVTTPARRDAIERTREDVIRFNSSLLQDFSPEDFEIELDDPAAPSRISDPETRIKLLDDRSLRTILNNPILLENSDEIQFDRRDFEREFQRRRTDKP